MGIKEAQEIAGRLSTLSVLECHTIEEALEHMEDTYADLPRTIKAAGITEEDLEALDEATRRVDEGLSGKIKDIFGYIELDAHALIWWKYAGARVTGRAEETLQDTLACFEVVMNATWLNEPDKVDLWLDSIENLGPRTAGQMVEALD